MGGQGQFSFLTETYLKGSNAVFYFIDSSRLRNSQRHYQSTETQSSLKEYMDNKKIFYVATKADLEENNWSNIESTLKQSFNIEDNIFNISSKEGTGIEDLKNFMIDYSKKEGNHSVSKNGELLSKYFLTSIGGAGKSSFIKRLLTGTFDPDCKMTIGPDFQVYTVTIDE